MTSHATLPCCEADRRSVEYWTRPEYFGVCPLCQLRVIAWRTDIDFTHQSRRNMDLTQVPSEQFRVGRAPFSRRINHGHVPVWRLGSARLGSESLGYPGFPSCRACQLTGTTVFALLHVFLGPCCLFVYLGLLNHFVSLSKYDLLPSLSGSHPIAQSKLIKQP